MLIECSIHGMTSHTKHRNGNAVQKFRCNKCQAERVKSIVEAKRKKAYEYYGSSCVICGYNRCSHALEWHHKDPNEKEITPARVFSRSWENIKKELDKCVLLCSNCHREVHAGLATI